ncbi:MAG: PQQ-like beta-propeller repeat protein [Micrococcales bacterium]|nr:PQQ-like beta-propeller repeat protein [Micrococcales bacterium]
MAFDPPSRFDLDQAVEVPRARAEFGTLHGTTLLWVEEDGTARSADLADPGRSWVTPLPTGCTYVRLMAPFVVGDVVVVATGEDGETDPEGNVPYTVNITGLGIDDGTVLWSISTPIDRPFTPRSAKMNTDLGAVERNGDVLLTFHPLADYPSVLIDPVNGEVRWKSHADTVPVMSGGYSGVVPAISGRYTVAAHLGSMYSLDLETGQAAAEPLLRGRSRHVDPVDPTYIILHPERTSSSRSLLRFSTVDGTVETFTPDPDDIRYNGDYNCLREGDLAWVCRGTSPPYSIIGLDPASGEVLWMETDHTDGLVFFRDHVYGAGSGYGDYAVIDQSTGRVITSNINISGSPIQVNEYGVMGRVDKSGHPLFGKWVWVPASG